jgi:hypothetical protein
MEVMEELERSQNFSGDRATAHDMDEFHMFKFQAAERGDENTQDTPKRKSDSELGLQGRLAILWYHDR